MVMGSIGSQHARRLDSRDEKLLGNIISAEGNWADPEGVRGTQRIHDQEISQSRAKLRNRGMACSSRISSKPTHR
eukprot:m.231523 g.231523  ORF g.231523 m.231523 type:complete len:75 (-) comp54278_c1_seq5:920-1144(-)